MHCDCVNKIPIRLLHYREECMCAPPQLRPAQPGHGEQLEVATNQGHNVTTVSRYIPALLALINMCVGALEWVLGRVG